MHAMAKKKKVLEEKIEIRAERELVERMDAAAKRFGLSRSAFARLAIIQAIEKAEKEERQS